MPPPLTIEASLSVPRAEWEAVRESLYGVQRRGTAAGLTEALRRAVYDALNEQMPIGVEWPPDDVIEAAVGAIVRSMDPTVGTIETTETFVEITPDAYEVLLGEALY
jgi:hypothetical protein